MQVFSLNREILELPESHPAHRFIRAFAECNQNCVGRELSNKPIDQQWYSQTDGQVWSYSRFAYEFLAFDIVLDGWLSHAARRTPNEEYWLNQLPRWRELLRECSIAAEHDANYAMLVIVEQVVRMYDLWEQCILARDTAADDQYPRHANRRLYPCTEEPKGDAIDAERLEGENRRDSRI
jgi:hypothetical protein